MNLSLLRNMRERLLAAVAEERLRTSPQTSLGAGAGGDKTFPVDRMAEEIIFEELEASGLPMTLISEEAGVKTSRGGGIRVLIDPIDGSKNAISGIPFFCVSIAVADGDTIADIETAYVLHLITGDEFCAERGKGAFLNDRPVSAQASDIFSLVAYEAPVPSKDVARILPLLTQAHKSRCFGSTALDLAYLAAGSVSVFAAPSPSRSFDFGGGWLLVKEAGGIVSDLSGNSIASVRLGLERSTSLLAAGNDRLHEKALKVLNG